NSANPTGGSVNGGTAEASAGQTGGSVNTGSEQTGTTESGSAGTGATNTGSGSVETGPGSSENTSNPIVDTDVNVNPDSGTVEGGATVDTSGQLADRQIIDTSVNAE